MRREIVAPSSSSIYGLLLSALPGRPDQATARQRDAAVRRGEGTDCLSREGRLGRGLETPALGSELDEATRSEGEAELWLPIGGRLSSLAGTESSIGRPNGMSRFSNGTASRCARWSRRTNSGVGSRGPVYPMRSR
jgi:hypothetical protein